MNTVRISASTLPMADREHAAAGYLAVMGALAEQLEEMTAADWATDTECTGWTVRDMVGHLLGAQEDAKSPPVVLARRFRGRRRYPRLSLLDAANQVQVDDHARLSPAELCAAYRGNIPKVAAYVRRFPAALAGIPVEKGTAPAGGPVRMGYLYNVIYLRDAWMHTIDLSRATSSPRLRDRAAGSSEFAAAQTMIVDQIMRDASIAWGAGPAVEVELRGEISGVWQLGEGEVCARIAGSGVDAFRRLSGRAPDTEVLAVSGDPALAQKFAGLRILF